MDATKCQSQYQGFIIESSELFLIFSAVKHIIPKVFYLSKKLQFLTGKKLDFSSRNSLLLNILRFFLILGIEFFGQN